MYQIQLRSRSCVQYNLSRVSPWLSESRRAASCEAARPTPTAARRNCFIQKATKQAEAVDAEPAALARDAAAQRRQLLLGAALTCVSGQRCEAALPIIVSMLRVY